jgi:hypothetical protein
MKTKRNYIWGYANKKRMNTPGLEHMYFFCDPILFAICISIFGARSSVLVKALRYKPEGLGFDTR